MSVLFFFNIGVKAYNALIWFLSLGIFPSIFLILYNIFDLFLFLPPLYKLLGCIIIMKILLLTYRFWRRRIHHLKWITSLIIIFMIMWIYYLRNSQSFLIIYKILLLFQILVRFRRKMFRSKMVFIIINRIFLLNLNRIIINFFESWLFLPPLLIIFSQIITIILLLVLLGRIMAEVILVSRSFFNIWRILAG